MSAISITFRKTIIKDVAKRFLCIFAAVICAFSLCFAQQETDAEKKPALSVMIESEEPSWEVVIGGKAICTPETTSYGFAVLMDGRTIASFSSDGTFLWQYGLRGKPEPFFSVNSEDFIYAVTGGTRLNMLNPSGSVLWSVNTGFSITQKPLEGFDGRIFVRGDEYIACYGVNGVRKWRLHSAKLSTLPLCILNDGSVMAFFAAANEATEAARISPFGEEIETVKFRGIVSAALSTKCGVLVAYSDGTVECCAAVSSPSEASESSEKNVKAVWSSQKVLSQQSAAPPKILGIVHESIVIATSKSNGAQVTLLYSGTGIKQRQFTLQGISFSGIIYDQINDDGFMLSDSKNAVHCSLEAAALNSTSPVPKLDWKAQLPPVTDTSWNQIYYSPEGTLVLCDSSWGMKGYRLMQTKKSVRSSASAKREQKNYMAFVKSQSPAGETQEISEAALENGDYGVNEAAWAKELMKEIDDFLMVTSSKIVNASEEESAVRADKLRFIKEFEKASLFGVNMFQSRLSALAVSESDYAYIAMYVNLIKMCAYDPAGVMLDSLEAILRSLPKKQAVVCTAICDAVYSICSFMGRKAFHRKGRSILSRLLTSEYPTQTSEHAKTVLLMLASLDAP